MITLVSPPLGEGQAGFDGLTAAARRTLGSEAIVIVFEPGTRPPVVVAAEGLAAGELAGLERGLSDSGEAYLQREFEGVLSAPVVHDGERLGAIHALKRDGDPFENAALIANFAVQVAIAFGLRRRPAATTGALAPERDEMLGELDQLVLSVHNLEDLSSALAGVIAPLFDGAISGLMVADSQRNVLQMIPGSFGADREVAASHQVSIFDPRSNSARVFTTGQPHLSNTSEEDAGIRQEYVDVFGIHRLLTVPLRQVGVLHIANKPDGFTLADVERALALAPRIASVVELATTLFRLRRQQRLEGILARVAVAVASGADAHDFLVPALQELCEVTEASLLAIVPDDGPPILARRGERDVVLEQTVLDEAGDEPGIRAYVIGPEKAGDPGWAAFYVPVYLGRQRMGTLAAYRLRGEPFARADRRALARMANLAALARATERYQRQRAELARMQERQRIADDLHDDVAQILFAAQLSLDAILQRGGLDDDAVTGIARARGLLIRGDTAIRTVIHRLSSPPAADIGTRLASVVSSVEDEFAVAAALVVDDDAAVRARELPRTTSDALVKVAREALVNAAKHAGPCHVDVRLELAPRDRLRLVVEDDGCGRASAGAAAAGDGEHHHGLLALRRSIREQDGTLRVTRGHGGGTRVTASVPLAGAPDLAAAPREPTALA
ncbi:GAF domain-containing protein [Conexibacter sp. CPCC 206217]|uniref:GAF domain-containing sensor histidine kinase n=1 Tax=Conexibacter sp. CPCC 206217 TaxID=3064574 RepID=UPI00271E3EEA|nr:GAF domain-containing protein [Conexibacter sp. CPCC 206217]MDO8212460.1 GAF domain-containing protein [Conexibacter sp. CPCC 206217]